jgi:hypothetical protein
MTWFRGLVGGVAAFAVFGLTSTSALAAGGSSIASAPVVSYGQQEYGSIGDSQEQTRDHCDTGDYPAGTSWWNLLVRAGDRVTIDFESNPSVDAGLTVFSVGTTDFQVGTVGESVYAIPDQNGKGQTTFNAPKSGGMPLGFFGCEATGPYDLTAYVRHGLFLYLKASGYASHQTKFYLALHTPDGKPVGSKSLVGDVQRNDPKEGNRWITSFHVYPGKPYNGKWNFSYHWMNYLHGQNVKVRVLVHGPGYQNTTSNTAQVKAF